MTADVIEIEFANEGHGGAAITLAVNGKRTVLSPVTYLTHPLGDLVRAALCFATGGERTICVFEREPDKWRLDLKRDESDAERLEITVWDVYEAPSDSPHLTRPDKRVFDARCTIESFGRAIERVADKALNDQGLEGYRGNWRHRFPRRALAALQVALDGQGPSADRWAPLPELPAWE
jgi:hypothetical protein